MLFSILLLPKYILYFSLYVVNLLHGSNLVILMNEGNSKNINTDELSLSFKFRDEKATREHNLCRSIKAPNLHTVRVNVHS